MSAFKDHFSANASSYALYRPDYPSGLFDDLAGLCIQTHHAWDCGCGNGQASLGLASVFDQVTATDPSEKQIENARAHPKISYQRGAAEASPLNDGSVDLILAAQAAHWFDLAAFYAEVQRVAKPGAVLALITYGPLEADAPVNDTLQEIYHGPIGSHWPPERRHVENGYSEFNFPFAGLEITQHAMQAAWSLETVVGYISTWSATKVYREKIGTDPIPDVHDRLAAVWGDPTQKREIRWPLGGLIGRVS